MSNYPNNSAATRYIPSSYLSTPEYTTRSRNDQQYTPSSEPYYPPNSNIYSRSNPNLSSPHYYEEDYYPPQASDDHFARRHHHDHDDYTPYASSDSDRSRHSRHKHHHRSKSRSHTPNPLHRLTSTASTLKDKTTSTLHLPSQPSDEKHPGLALLAAGTGAAAIAAADKYLVHGEKKEESTMRLIADAAVGGLLGYGAYRYFDGEKEKKERKERRREKKVRDRERDREDEDVGYGREIGRRRSFVEGYDERGRW